MELEFPEEDLLVQAGCAAVSSVIGRFGAGGYAMAWHQYFEKSSSGWVLIGEMMKEFNEKEAPAVKPKKFVKPPTHVGVVVGRTVNMGDFESVKVGVLLIEPCDSADREDTYADALAWVSSKVQTEVDEAVEAREDLSKSKKGSRR